MKISVIMPLYNAGKYLEESLKSVLSQTLSDFELICINDASTDNTISILLAFQKEDDRIVVLENEKRQGAAYSRNRGIGIARGTYLSFLDGDDIFDETMLEAGYQAASGNAVDVVVFEFKHVLSDVIYQKEKVRHKKEYKNKFCQQPFRISEITPCEFLIFSSGPWNKLYKREFVMKQQLRFQTLSCSNDVYFVLMAMMLANRVLVLNDNKVMVYARDHFEPSRISFNRDPMCAYKAMEKLQEELIERGLFCELYEHFYLRLFFTLQCALKSTIDANTARNFYNYIKSQGISVLRKKGSEYYAKLAPYIKYLLGQFELMDFSTGWYEKIDVLELFMEEKADKVIGLFHRLAQEGKTTGVWGAGRNGSILLELCNRKQIYIDMVVDMNPEKQGKQIAGYTIQSPEQAYDKLQAVIVVGRTVGESVKQFLENKGIHINVIDMIEYLEIVI